MSEPKKLFSLICIEDKDYPDECGSYESLEDLQNDWSFTAFEAKNYVIREYDLVKEHKIKIVTETTMVERKVEKVVLK